MLCECANNNKTLALTVEECTFPGGVNGGSFGSGFSCSTFLSWVFHPIIAKGSNSAMHRCWVPHWKGSKIAFASRFTSRPVYDFLPISIGMSLKSTLS